VLPDSSLGLPLLETDTDPHLRRTVIA
jgi:hypothetical protein